VPGWHEATRELWKDGKLQVVGILEEQHPDRAGLFMQWKQMDWPLMVDSLNLLETVAVPVTLCIDEYGIIRLVNPPRKDADRLEEFFLSRTYAKPSATIAKAGAPPNLARLKAAAANGAVATLRDYGNSLFLWGCPERLNEAIEIYERALRQEPGDGATHFHLGVAFRRRYDSDARHTGDFQRSVDEWKTALDIDPNQYIWRRRIQQYGPRLDKPYSFYDWVIAARNDIRKRGETPVPLAVEPGGAEFAQPPKAAEASEAEHDQPDPKGRITRDTRKLIMIETAVVPPTKATGSTARVHVEFRPNNRLKAHWNNEAGPLVLWVNAPPGWETNGNYFSLQNPPESVSLEPRRLEFEVRPPDAQGNGAFLVPAYALYYVCEDVNGVCLYRRQDIEINVKLK
jgi:tetratricopeptide (TPR) repeat protein